MNQQVEFVDLEGMAAVAVDRLGLVGSLAAAIPATLEVVGLRAQAPDQDLPARHAQCGQREDQEETGEAVHEGDGYRLYVHFRPAVRRI